MTTPRWILASLIAGSLCLPAVSPAAAAPAAPQPAAAAQGAPNEAAPPAELGAEPSYVLRFGDTITLSMTGDETFKLENQAIRPDGRLSVPLLGEVKAGGLTVRQLTASLEQSYRRYIIHPRLVVNVATFRQLKLTVLGLVAHPGTYTMPEPTDLLGGLALAGGLTPYRADLHAVEVRRASGQRELVDLERVLHGTAPTTVLGDGDTVVVNEVAGLDWERYLPHLATVLSIVGSVAMITWNVTH